MPTPSHILLADFSDWLRIIIPIVFVTLYSIQQWVGGLQEAKRKAAKKQQPRPVPPPELAAGRPPVAAGDKPAGATLEETLRREVEEFLRRAQGQPPAQPAPPPARPAAAAKPAAQQRPAVSPPRERPPARQAQRPSSPQPAAPRRLVDEPRSQPSPLRETARPLGGALGQQVAEHLRGAEAVAQHARTLGAEISQADERLEQHLREKFQHQVGVLAPATTREDARRAATSPAAQELREMLARPGGARQLVIAHEILRRPEERW